MRRSSLLLFLACACTAAEGPPLAPECGYHDDCPDGRVCFAGRCEASATCFERSGCRNVPVCAGDRCLCTEDTNRCVPVCVTDGDCPSDGLCLDGVCRRYPLELGGTPPVLGPSGALRAGVARVELDFPLGVSLAGYGARRGPKTPYQSALGGSNAWLDKPDVRALALDDGEEMIILVRSPTCWVSDELLAATAAEVARRTGVDVLDRLVLVASHSHSEPARFWHMVKELRLGLFGYDEYSGEIFARITGSLADAVVAALDAMQPARFGYTVLDDFDPEDRIHRDRRGRNDGLPILQKDDRMVLMRVDDEAGTPLALIINMAMHSTVYDWDNPIVTGDASAGVEVEATLAASAHWGRPVLAFWAQSNSGDISPAGDDLGHPPAERLQLIGRRVWSVIAPALETIETRSDARVALASRRLPITREALGYADGEFHDTGVVCESSPPYFRYGAFQCVEGRWDDADPITRFDDGELGCVFAVECMTGGFAIPQFQKTQVSALRLGDLVLAALPGEPVSSFGRNLSERVLAAVPGARDATVLGYAQDYQFYLLEEEDWFQGGYEPSRAIWGWKFAPYLADRTVEVAAELAKAAAERALDGGNLKPMAWPVEMDDLERVPVTDTEGPPDRVVLEPAERPDRFELITFAWAGGHPGVDRPRVVLERETGGAFTAVERPGGLPYDDAAFEMLVRYEGTCNRSTCTDHTWRVEWEEQRDFPAGRYRLRADGHAQVGGEVVAYTARSRAFELVPSARLVIATASFSAGRLEGLAHDPPAAELRHLLRSELAPASAGGPLPLDEVLAARAVFTTDDGAVFTAEGMATVVAHEFAPRGEGVRWTARFVLEDASLAAVPPGTYTLALELEDGAGNRGSFAGPITR